MPLQATSGAASYDGFGGGVAAVPNYIEDVFSTYLYSGNSSTQTITNGIDLSTKGGLVWMKKRNSSSAGGHLLVDTANGTSTALSSNITDSSNSLSGFSSFNVNGYSMSNACSTYLSNGNASGDTYASWTFRKQPKFFDVVTYTGDGNSGRTIAHSLGSTPGFMIIKSTTLNNNWIVYHRSLGYQNWMILNSTSGALADSTQWVADPTSTVFTVGSGSLNNFSGQSYVAYVFAHNAGGFGLTGTDNVISCGSFSLNSSVGVDVNLGYEAQWVMIKRTDSSAGSSGWYLLDTMRGWTVDATFGDMYLVANTTAAEAGQSIGRPTATGFAIQASTWLSTGDYIYIAIRRGPMKVPTDATKVFSPVAFTGNTSSYTGTNTNTIGFAGDTYINKARTDASQRFLFADKLRGSQVCLYSSATDAEENFGSTQSTSEYIRFNNTQVELGGFSTNFSLYNYSGYSTIGYVLQRAPSFFDEVCYTGNDAANRNINHNLGVVPNLLIVKARSNTGDWFVNTSGAIKEIYLNYNFAGSTSTTYFGTNTSTTFNTGGAFTPTNTAGTNFVAYLFASCSGVSKVGSYTGNGSTQTINCGFTGGARFVLIKRTDSSGAWIVYDTARGINSGANDPFLSLTFTNAEANTEDAIDPASTGFIIKQEANRNLNVSGGTYIYLAIA